MKHPSNVDPWPDWCFVFVCVSQAEQQRQKEEVDGMVAQAKEELLQRERRKVERKAAKMAAKAS